MHEEKAEIYWRNFDFSGKERRLRREQLDSSPNVKTRHDLVWLDHARARPIKFLEMKIVLCQNNFLHFNTEPQAFMAPHSYEH